jgi:GNAT superfamily N-acetyltransferase
VEEIVTYLEMTAPGDLCPARPVDGVVLDPVEPHSPLIRAVHARIGAPYGWESASRSDEQWDRWLAHPLRRYWLVRHGDEVAGATDAEPQPDGQVEITTFGLLPTHVGRGLGGHALTLAVRQAWAVPPAGAAAVRRVWLHTSTLDHPHALPNYRRRGFRPFRTEARQRPERP